MSLGVMIGTVGGLLRNKATLGELLLVALLLYWIFKNYEGCFSGLVSCSGIFRKLLDRVVVEVNY